MYAHKHLLNFMFPVNKSVNKTECLYLRANREIRRSFFIFVQFRNTIYISICSLGSSKFGWSLNRSCSNIFLTLIDIKYFSKHNNLK